MRTPNRSASEAYQAIGGLSVIYLPVGDIKEYPHNSRMHTIEQIELIAKSMTEYGFTNPCLIDQDNELIAGHARLQASLKLGMTTVPCIRLGHLTPAQKRALVIADNKISITGTQWDYPLLKLELEALADVGFDLGLTGFDQGELDKLFSPPVDPKDEWKGMPEFDQDDKLAFHSITVHLKDAAAVAEFARLVDQKITDKTRFIWYPMAEIESYADKRYTADEP